MLNKDLLDPELASNSEIGSDVDIIPCGGCVFCSTHLNPSTKFTSSVTGKQFTLFSNEIPNTFACTTKNAVYLFTCGKCCIQYIGIKTFYLNRRTKFTHPKPTTVKYRLVEMFHKNTDEGSKMLNELKETSLTNITTVAVCVGIDIVLVETVIHWGPLYDILVYWQDVVYIITFLCWPDDC